MSFPSGNLRWIANYLTSRTRHVVGEGEMLAAANVLSGVPQGSVWGSLLIYIYGISAIPLVHERNQVIYADDIYAYIDQYYNSSIDSTRRKTF